MSDSCAPRYPTGTAGTLPEYGFAAVSDDPLPLQAYPHLHAIPTRWHDDDVYVGWFVHVLVDRESRRPVAIPQALRSALAALASPS